jgi:hypothetical protein
MIIHPLAFFISLGIGLFIVYITTPTPDVIVLYPTPQTVSKHIYQDPGNVCYQYTMDMTTCPANKKEIHQLPVQKMDPEEKKKESVLDEWKKKLAMAEKSSDKKPM